MSEVVFNSINRYISKIFAQQNLKLIVTNRYHKRKSKILKIFKKRWFLKEIVLTNRTQSLAIESYKA
ncbi:hypothetical protein HPSJM_00710 [Helicobacter pylori SJM180]|nr:hypothetical protein HPSJM_00710 [Helicobacter pylori SJM180]